MITFPFWFKIFIAYGLLSIIWQTYLLLNKAKHINKIKQLPEDKKAKKIRGRSKVIKILKLFLWAAPVYLILMSYALYRQNKLELFHYSVMMIILYIIIIECFVICKSIVLEFEQNK
jgi:hypothetical protein